MSAPTTSVTTTGCLPDTFARREPARAWVDVIVFTAVMVTFSITAGDAAFMRQPICTHWFDHPPNTFEIFRNIGFDAIVAVVIARYWQAMAVRERGIAAITCAMALMGYVAVVAVSGEPECEYRNILTAPRSTSLIGIALWCGWRTHRLADRSRNAVGERQGAQLSTLVAATWALAFITLMLVSGNDMNWKIGALAGGSAKVVGAATSLALFAAGRSAHDFFKTAAFILLAVTIAFLTLWM